MVMMGGGRADREDRIHSTAFLLAATPHHPKVFTAAYFVLFQSSPTELTRVCGSVGRGSCWWVLVARVVKALALLLRHLEDERVLQGTPTPTRGWSVSEGIGVLVAVGLLGIMPIWVGFNFCEILCCGCVWGSGVVRRGCGLRCNGTLTVRAYPPMGGRSTASRMGRGKE